MEPMTIAAITSVAGPLISSIFGKSAKKKREKQLQKSLMPLKDMLKEYQNRGKNGYMQTTEAKNFLNRLNTTSEDQRFQLANIAGLRGYSDEAELSGMNKINKAEASGVSSLVGNATRFRQNNMANRRRMLMNIFNAETGGRATNEETVSANTQRVGDGLSSALPAILQAFN